MFLTLLTFVPFRSKLIAWINTIRSPNIIITMLWVLGVMSIGGTIFLMIVIGEMLFDSFFNGVHIVPPATLLLIPVLSFINFVLLTGLEIFVGLLRGKVITCTAPGWYRMMSKRYWMTSVFED